MKKLISIILTFVLVFSYLAVHSSAATTIVPIVTQDELNYFDMAVGNQFYVYGRGTSAMTSDVSFIGLVVAGNVVNTYKKAVYTDIAFDLSSYTRYHTITTLNSSTGSSISQLSKSRGTGTNINSNNSYVELWRNYLSASARPNILVNTTLEAYLNASNRYISYPSITQAC